MTALPIANTRQLEACLRLLGLLADGHFHSGEELGEALGLGRSGVWRLVRGIEALGFEVHGVTGKGYRLAEPVALLESGRIRGHMDGERAARLSALEVLPTVDSTNRWLIGRALAGGPAPAAVVAEHQSGGRGRRGRAWVSPFGHNLYLSLLWYFDEPPRALAACSLAVAALVARGLMGLGIPEVALKWPNDVYAGGRKLAGILLELVGEATGPYRVVIGVGVNVNMVLADIDQPWTSLRIASGRPWDRNLVAARLLDQLLDGLDGFARHGIRDFLPDWEALDVARGRAVSLAVGEGTVQGIALGPDADGALRLRTARGIERFHSGEVSLRLAP